MSLQGFYLLPHPPIALPEIGKGEEKEISETSNSFNIIGKDISESSPDTIIIITPHGVMFQDAISITYEDEIYGDLKSFGVPSVSMNLPVNKNLSREIYELTRENNIPAVLTTNNILRKYNASVTLDHGAMVPLYFVNKYCSNYKLVHITYAPLSDIDLYKFGMNICNAAEKLNENAVIIASGDLSHRLKEDGPYGFNPYGEKFDREFLGLLKKGDVKGVFSIDKGTIENAGECGRRSVSILLGALDGKKFSGDVLSYQGTFGVGYGAVMFNVTGNDSPKLMELINIRKENFEKRKFQSDPYVKLARESLTSYLNTGKLISNIPDYVTEEMKNVRRGVFVSMKKGGELRGCIGTILPTTDSIAEEIIRNAVEAGMNDPRFYKVQEDELMDIDFSVDVLTEPEPADKSSLDPKKYGVIVKNKGESGLLLPDLEGVNTVEEQLSIALKKAGMEPDEEYSIQRFEVIRHKEV